MARTVSRSNRPLPRAEHGRSDEPHLSDETLQLLQALIRRQPERQSELLHVAGQGPHRLIHSRIVIPQLEAIFPIYFLTLPGACGKAPAVSQTGEGS